VSGAFIQEDAHIAGPHKEGLLRFIYHSWDV